MNIYVKLFSANNDKSNIRFIGKIDNFYQLGAPGIRREDLQGERLAYINSTNLPSDETINKQRFLETLYTAFNLILRLPWSFSKSMICDFCFPLPLNDLPVIYNAVRKVRGKIFQKMAN